jgi:hypothetical protein
MQDLLCPWHWRGCVCRCAETKGSETKVPLIYIIRCSCRGLNDEEMYDSEVLREEGMVKIVKVMTAISFIFS